MVPEGEDSGPSKAEGVARPVRTVAQVPLVLLAGAMELRHWKASGEVPSGVTHEMSVEALGEAAEIHSSESSDFPAFSVHTSNRERQCAAQESGLRPEELRSERSPGKARTACANLIPADARHQTANG